MSWIRLIMKKNNHLDDFAIIQGEVRSYTNEHEISTMKDEIIETCHG
jgi:hypothetical protein